MQAGSTQHEHYWDPLRAGLMLLGVPYHASLLYSDALPWSLKDFEASPLLTTLGIALATFRMPTFFLVAGYFSAMAIDRKGNGPWLQSRLLRLGIPFIAAILLLGPLQLVLLDIAAVVKGQAKFGEVISGLPQRLAPSSRWIMHLWFLPALLFYSALLATLMYVRERRSGRLIRQAFDDVKNTYPVPFLTAVCLLAILWELAIYGTVLLAAGRNSAILDFYDRASDPYARYLPFFLIGAMLNRDKALFHRYRQTGVLTAIVAITAIATSVVLQLQHPFSTSAWKVLASAIAAIATSRVLLDLCCRYLDRPNRFVKRLADASFTIYLVHHPLIYALGILFIMVGLPPVFEFTIIVIVTIGIALLLHGALRKSDMALFLFNGVQRPTDRRRPAPQSAPQTLR